MRPRELFLALGILLLACVATLTIVRIAPPSPRLEGAPETEFSADRAARYVEAISREPHPVGSEAHDKVKGYLLETLAGLGVETRVQETTAVEKAVGVVHAAHVENIIATLPGTHPGHAVLLAAHYDSVPQSRGASDDGSGVATLLETLRALKASPPLANDVVLLFSDGEELGTLGAMAFTRDELGKEPIDVALNFEARGTGGAVALYDMSEHDGALVRAVSAAGPRIVSSSLLGTLARTLPNDSDASIFKRAKIPTFAFAYVDHLFQYHQHTDALDALDRGSLQQDGDYALSLTRTLGNGALPLPDDPEVAFFDVFGLGLVSYSAFTARLLALLTLGGAVWVVARGVREKLVTGRKGLAGVVVAIIALGVAALSGWLVQRALRVLVDPFVLLARPTPAVVAAVVVGAVAAVGVLSFGARRLGAMNVAVGGLSVFSLLLALTGLLLPTASFAFQWPLVFATLGVAVWLRTSESPREWDGLAIAVTLVPAAFFWSHLAYTVLLMMAGAAPPIVAVVAVFPLLLAVPLIDLAPGLPSRQSAIGVLALAAVALVVAAGAVLRTAPPLPRPDSLEYTVEPERRSAKWVTNRHESDAFTEQRVAAGQSGTKAPMYDLAPLEITEKVVDEGALSHRTVTFKSRRRLRCVWTWPQHEEPTDRVLFDGQPAVEIVRFSSELDRRIAKLQPGVVHRSSTLFEYCGVGEGGFTFELFGPRGDKLKFGVSTFADGLPDSTLRPRTAADGYPDTDSDRTVTTQEVTF